METLYSKRQKNTRECKSIGTPKVVILLLLGWQNFCSQVYFSAFFLENLDKKGLLSRSLSSLRNLAPSATFLLYPNTAFDSCLGLKCMKKEVGSIGIFSIFKALFLSNRAYWCLQFLFVGFAIKCYQNTQLLYRAIIFLDPWKKRCSRGLRIVLFPV